MKLPKINLIHHINSKKSSLKIFLAGKFFVYAIVIIGLLISALSYQIIFSEDGISQNLGKLNIVNQIKHLVTSNDKNLRGEGEDRINILLLGIGGKSHDGGQLTDTNIIISVKPSNGEVAMLSIPRDLYVPIAEYGVWRKINSANAYGEWNEEGSGPKVAAQTIENIFNLPIHYYVRVDFQGFEQVIDEFGGVDVYVENTLSDYKYPIRGKEDVMPIENRYEHLYIEKGWQHMDGELALKYARSRHAQGIEGSDFARSRRQQKVLSALKDKVFKFTTFLNMNKINGLLGALNEHVATDMEIWEILRFADIAKKIDNEKIKNHVLSDGPGELLYATITPDGAYILKPRSENWSSLRNLAQNIFASPGEAQMAAAVVSEPEIINIEIQNGTKKNGYAGQTSYILEQMGFNIINIRNAEEQNYEKTIIYDLTNGEKLSALKELKEKLDANVALTLPGWLTASFYGEKIENTEINSQNNFNTQADFLIILGENSIPIIFGGQIADNK